MFHLPSFNLLVFIILSVCSRVNTEENGNSATNIVRSFTEVPLDDYGPDACHPRTIEMPDFHAPGRRISEVKCFEYVWKAKYGFQEKQRRTTCDFIRGLDPVLGGTKAHLGNYSHVGAVGWKSTNGTWVFKCGSSLISEKFALTAAHCSMITNKDPEITDLEPKIVRVGTTTLLNGFITREATNLNIKRFIVHPKYHSPSVYYDVALIEFEEEIKFQWLMHPSCLHSTFDVPEKVYVAGWGVFHLYDRKTSPDLLVAEVSTVESNFCDYLLHKKHSRNWDGVADHQICAGNLTGGVDTCQGDSGGPLSQFIESKSYEWAVHRIVGVTSFGFGCGRANSPGVYTRVASFIDWIEGIVWPSEA